MTKTVLIVEDNQHLREILGSILRYSGYDILEASTGKEAIRKTVDAKPQLVLLDLELPDIAGIEVARTIKATAGVSHIPIVACSASSGWEWREEALRAGMSEYLQKPIQFAVMKQIIDKFILSGDNS
jgi:two-component system, cell cycle response regulator DivK